MRLVCVEHQVKLIRGEFTSVFIQNTPLCGSKSRLTVKFMQRHTMQHSEGMLKDVCTEWLKLFYSLNNLIKELMIIGIMPCSQNTLKLNINIMHWSLKVLLFTLGQYQCSVSEMWKQCTKDQRFRSCCFIFSYLRLLTIAIAITFFIYSFIHLFLLFVHSCKKKKLIYLFIT